MFRTSTKITKHESKGAATSMLRACHRAAGQQAGSLWPRLKPGCALLASLIITEGMTYAVWFRL